MKAVLVCLEEISIFVAISQNTATVQNICGILTTWWLFNGFKHETIVHWMDLSLEYYAKSKELHRDTKTVAQ